MDWYMAVLQKFAQFDGRSRRKEYWMFTLVNLCIAVALNVASRAVGVLAFVNLLYSLAVLIPAIAVSIRRLHDTGKSGWFLLIAFVPVLGAFLLLYWMAQDGEPGTNQYGPNPKTETAFA
ncbi:MAG: hypothetical protein JWM27_163 [Gemmatimonadetes bacterium]|nr:hypothetical protein [Gemmatimonadota bacterium]